MDAEKLTKKDLQKLSASIGRLTVSDGRTALTDPKLLEGVVTCLKKVSDLSELALFALQFLQVHCSWVTWPLACCPVAAA